MQGKDVALFREPLAAGDSALVRYLESHGPPTNLAISHIRHATQGALTLANTQPFVRQLGARTHVFAHNGDLTGLEKHAVSMSGQRPVGETDSELAFCLLLARLSSVWAGAEVPSIEARTSIVAEFASDMRTLGPANFLYADGDVVFAHGHRRWNQANRKVEPPGLWMLNSKCVHDAPRDGHPVSIVSEVETSLLIASVPLTEASTWQPLGEGELVISRNGKAIEQVT